MNYISSWANADDLEHLGVGLSTAGEFVAYGNRWSNLLAEGQKDTILYFVTDLPIRRGLRAKAFDEVFVGVARVERNELDPSLAAEPFVLIYQLTVSQTTIPVNDADGFADYGRGSCPSPGGRRRFSSWDRSRPLAPNDGWARLLRRAVASHAVWSSWCRACRLQVNCQAVVLCPSCGPARPTEPSERFEGLPASTVPGGPRRWRLLAQLSTPSRVLPADKQSVLEPG